MNIVDIIENVKKFKLFVIGLLILGFASLSFAGGNPTAISAAMSELCAAVKGFLGIAIFLMIILAAITYAVGQIMGAETRARASVWATAMFTGALFAALIYLIIPWAINSIAGLDVSESC